jgi:autotransporter passenger strand-loop-strand repeat protein
VSGVTISGSGSTGGAGPNGGSGPNGSTVASGEAQIYGAASGNTVYGIQVIASGGVDSGSEVTSGGVEIVSSGGSAIGVQIDSGGVLSADPAASLSQIDIQSGGSIDLYGLGFSAGEQVTVGSGGVLTVTSVDGVTPIETLQLSAVDAGDVFQIGSDGQGGSLIVNEGLPIVMLSGSTVSGASVGAGSALAVSGTLVSATVSSGGVAQIQSGGVASGTEIGSGGTQVVNGGGVASDTVVTDGGTQVVGAGGTASASIITSGGVQAIASGGTASASVISEGGTQAIGSGGTASGSIISSGGTELVQSGGQTVGAFVAAGGTEAVLPGGTMLSGSVDGATDGTVNVSGGTTISNVLLSGSIENVLSGGLASATLIDSGGSQFIESGGTASGTVISGGGLEIVGSGGSDNGVTVDSGGTLVLDGGSVSGALLEQGAQLDLSGVSYASADQVTVSGGILTVTDGGNTLATINVAGDYNGAAYTVSDDGAGGTLVTEAICYLRGTRILTPTGERLVESLAIGDAVVTRFGGIQAIRWIGRQTYAAEAIREDREQIPVHLRPGSLGDRLPVRDLYVSPGHSMLVNGTLILAKSLVNGVTITQDWMPGTVDYYQLDLGTHDCVIAEGTWSETFADGEGLRDRFHNAEEFHAMFPEYRPPESLVALCAPRPLSGPALGARLQPIVARATAGCTPGPLKGFVDRVTGEWKIEGWAQDTDHPELPVLLEVLLEGRVIGTVLACDFRADLLKAKLGQGRCSFVFESPIKLRPDRLASLQVRRVSDKAGLPISSAMRAGLATAVKPATPGAETVEAWGTPVRGRAVGSRSPRTQDLPITG